MSWAIVALSVMGFGFAATAIAVGLRLSGVRETLSRREEELHATAKQLEETAHEFHRYKARTMHQLEALRRDISNLEAEVDACLESCTDPRALRDNLRRVLSKAAHADPDTDPD